MPAQAGSSTPFSPQRHRVTEKFKTVDFAFLCASVSLWWLLQFLNRHSERRFRPRNRPVERVTLDRFSPGFRDQAHQVVPPQALRSGRSRIVVNLFLDNGAVNIVGSEPQRYLRN